jgi:uncharacterized protein (DUF488 family)
MDRRFVVAFDISYEHMAALGGLRGKAQSSPQDVNGFWTNESFHNYADYALSAQFHAGLKLLLDEGRKRRCVIMCSEAVWWRCHRRIVTDYLIACGQCWASKRCLGIAPGQNWEQLLLRDGVCGG